MIEIKLMDSCSKDDAEIISRLLSELHGRTITLNESDLKRVIDSTFNKMIVARQNGGIIGIADLQILVGLGSVRSRLEDVVVDPSARGQGVGRKLVQEALRLAKEAGASHNELTSHQNREAAHKLYESEGYEKRDTVVFRKNFKP